MIYYGQVKYKCELMMVVKHQNGGKRKLTNVVEIQIGKRSSLWQKKRWKIKCVEKPNGENSKIKYFVKNQNGEKLDLSCKHYKTG